MSTEREHHKLHLALIALFAVIPALPLVLHGCSCGHDFSFHLMSWLDAASQFRHGTVHPQWAYSPAYNAGEPRFVFYPPLSWYLGASIGLILGALPGVGENAAWNAAPILYTWLALLLSGWAMYRLARHFGGGRAALVAAALYLANPYMLFTAYERTAFAELLAAAWLPWLLLGALRRRPSILGIALPLALLWLTNAPAAVIGSYSLALLTFLRVIPSTRASSYTRQRAAGLSSTRTPALAEGLPRKIQSPYPVLAEVPSQLHLLRTVASGTALGFLLAAFYIVPAAYERRFVQIAMAVIPHLRIQDNFIFHHFTGPEAAFHNQVLHTASMIAVALWISAAALLVSNHFAHKSPGRPRGLPTIPLRPLAVVVGVVGLLLTPWSLPVWNHAPEAAFLQFPWRSLSIIAIVVALASATLLARVRWQRGVAPIVGVVITVLLVLLSSRTFRQACDPTLTPGSLLTLFQSSQGSEPTDEYTPITADNDALAPSNPPYWIADSQNAAPPPGAHPGPAPSSLELRLPRPTDLILNLRAFPAWSVTLDGESDLQRLDRDDGLLAVPLPAGSSTVNVRYTRLPDQKIGDILTLLGIGLGAASLLPPRWRRRRVTQPMEQAAE